DDCSWERSLCSSRRRHTRLVSDWSSDVCSSDLLNAAYFCSPDQAQQQRREFGWLLQSADAYAATLPASANAPPPLMQGLGDAHRSEERRVGKECRSRWERECAQTRGERQCVRGS